MHDTSLFYCRTIQKIHPQNPYLLHHPHARLLHGMLLQTFFAVPYPTSGMLCLPHGSNKFKFGFTSAAFALCCRQGNFPVASGANSPIYHLVLLLSL